MGLRCQDCLRHRALRHGLVKPAQLLVALHQVHEGNLEKLGKGTAEFQHMKQMKVRKVGFLSQQERLQTRASHEPRQSAFDHQHRPDTEHPGLTFGLEAQRLGEVATHEEPVEEGPAQREGDVVVQCVDFGTALRIVTGVELGRLRIGSGQIATDCLALRDTHAIDVR